MEENVTQCDRHKYHVHEKLQSGEAITLSACTRGVWTRVLQELQFG